MDLLLHQPRLRSHQGCGPIDTIVCAFALQIIVNGHSTDQPQLQLDLRLLNDLETVQVVRRSGRTTMLFVSFVALSCLCLCFVVDFATGRRAAREKIRSFEVITRFGDHMFAKTGGLYAFDIAALHALCSRERNADESLIFLTQIEAKAVFEPLRAAKCHAATSVVAEFIAFISVS